VRELKKGAERSESGHAALGWRCSLRLVSCWNYSDLISDIKKRTNAQTGKNLIEPAEAVLNLRRDLEWNTKFYIMPEVVPGDPHRRRFTRWQEQGHGFFLSSDESQTMKDSSPILEVAIDRARRSVVEILRTGDCAALWMSVT
jgi:hypothetical protein